MNSRLLASKYYLLLNMEIVTSGEKADSLGEYRALDKRYGFYLSARISGGTKCKSKVRCGWSRFFIVREAVSFHKEEWVVAT